jgi:hypothetical protein
MKITDSRLRLSASDVANYLACQHLSRLDLQRAQGTLRPPHEFDLGFQDVGCEPDAPGRVGGIRAVPLAEGSAEQDIVIGHQQSFRRISLDTSPCTGHHAAGCPGRAGRRSPSRMTWSRCRALVSHSSGSRRVR